MVSLTRSRATSFGKTSEFWRGPRVTSRPWSNMKLRAASLRLLAEPVTVSKRSSLLALPAASKLLNVPRDPRMDSRNSHRALGEAAQLLGGLR